MQEPAKLHFYDIKACGYYTLGGKARAFGEPASTLSNLLSWVKQDGKALQETCTYTPSEDDPFMHTYCLDMQKDSKGDFVLVSWNETPLADGLVESVDGTQPVGVAAIEGTELPNTTSIPGYPAYFWILPSEGLLVTIQFGDMRNGHLAIDKYLTGFLERHSKFVAAQPSTEPDADDQQLGYCEHPGDTPQHLIPRFKSVLKHNHADLDHLRTNRNRITKVVRHQILKPGKSKNQSLYKRLLKHLGFVGEPMLSSEVKVDYTIDMCPTEAEFEEILASFSEEQNESAWQRTGFRLQGSQTPVWLDSARARVDIELDVARGDQKTVSATSILEAISARRANLISTLD